MEDSPRLIERRSGFAGRGSAAVSLAPGAIRRRWWLRRRAAIAIVGLLVAGALAAGSVPAAEPALAERAAERAPEVLAEARVHAGADRHGLAVACALAALQLDPGLEAEAALLIAHQLTWQERSDEAIPWYRRHLAHHPGDREGRVGLARALSWAGETDEALALYEELAAEDPSDAEARAGVARMSAWRGRHRQAANAYERMLEDDPTDREARLGAGAAENHRGRHRRAAAHYRALLAVDSNDDEARRGLARALRWDGRGSAALDVLAASDSPEAAADAAAIRRDRGLRIEAFGGAWKDVDDQELRQLGLGFERGFPRDVTLRLRGADVRVDEPIAGEILAKRASLGAAWRAADAWQTNAILTVEAIDDPGRTVDTGSAELVAGGDVETTRILADSWVTWSADWTRLTLGYGRVPIETPKSMARGLHVDVASVEGERRVHDVWSISARLTRSEFSDDNRRLAGEGALRAGPWHPGRRTTIRAELGVSRFTFDETVDRGYYSPEEYDAGWFGSEFAFDLDDVSLLVSGRVASESEDGGDRFGVAAGGLEARWALHPAFALSAFARKSTSRFDTGAGYEREGVGAALHWQP